MRFRAALALTLALATSVLSAATVSAQGFRAVFSRDGLDVWAVGDSGRIYRSFDSGTNYVPFTLGDRTLRDIVARGLTVVTVSDSGKIWRSTDSGGSWALTVVPGAPNMRGVALPTPTDGWAVGGLGTIMHTFNGGATWTPQSSGVGTKLNAVAFTNASNGWAAGDAGVLLRTTDGGATWTPIALGTPNNLLSVDQRGTGVWAVGENGAAFRSTNSGTSFSPYNLKLDARADVNVVHMQSADTLWIGGGGGFIRFTTNGGATWTFQQHRIHAPITGFFGFNQFAWAANSSNKVVIYSTDRGNFWRFPNAATFLRNWGAAPKLSFAGQVRGSSFALNPVYKSTIYVALGDKVFVSRDDAENWSTLASLPAGFNKVNSFVVSAKDSTKWLVAAWGSTPGDNLLRTTDSGVTWTSVLQRTWGEYGNPIEADPDHPDTLYFGGEQDFSGTPLAALFRSSNFGASWDSLSNAAFRSPCDIEVVPDSSNIIVVGDGITGSGSAQYFRSTDGGVTFNLAATKSTSEIPAIATNRLRNNAIFGTNWTTGGAQRSTDYGATWPDVSSASSPWGIDIARDDPNVIMFGQYVGTSTFISVDGGTTWTTFDTPAAGVFGNNYSIFLRDRGLLLAEQSGGVWKLNTTYSYAPITAPPTATVTAPNGGEVWPPGQARTINWSAPLLPLVRLEYRRALGEPWQFIADVPGYTTFYSWTVPFDGGTQVKVRVKDAWDGAPEDTSNAVFTISAPRILASPSAFDFGNVPTGSSTTQALTLKNDGATQLDITSITLGSPAYHPGRTSLSLLPGAQDTIGVTFQPGSGGNFPTNLTVVSNDTGHSPLVLPVNGTAGHLVDLTQPAGGEFWQYNSLHSISWTSTLVSQVTLEYRSDPADPWTLIATNVPANPPTYPWTIPFDPGSAASVRIREVGGSARDSSAAFTLASPLLSTEPDTLYLGVVAVGRTSSGVLDLDNMGNGVLSVSSATSNKSEFHLGRHNFTVQPGSPTR
jgi:photosystem II stability/assembly factor-like uncharacterized protein